MKKKLFFAGVALLIASAAVTGIIAFANATRSGLISTDVDALAGCEITNKKGEVLFSCSGENTCSETYLGKTLTCDGTKD